MSYGVDSLGLGGGYRKDQKDQKLDKLPGGPDPAAWAQGGGRKNRKYRKPDKLPGAGRGERRKDRKDQK